jgi:hypothetical protein
LLLLTACTTPSTFDEWTRNASRGDLLPARAVTLEGSTPNVVAHVTIRHMPHLADVAGGLPIVVPPERPIAGKPWTLAFTTRPTAPFPSAPVALFVSFRPPSAAKPIPNARGGMLQVPPDLVFKPGQVDWLTQEGGTVRLDITFQPAHIGTRIWCQLVVKDEVAGVLTSPVVAMTVGSR